MKAIYLRNNLLFVVAYLNLGHNISVISSSVLELVQQDLAWMTAGQFSANDLDLLLRILIQVVQLGNLQNYGVFLGLLKIKIHD
jgi:hypothetical protein